MIDLIFNFLLGLILDGLDHIRKLIEFLLAVVSKLRLLTLLIFLHVLLHKLLISILLETIQSHFVRLLHQVLVELLQNMIVLFKQVSLFNKFYFKF